MTAAHSRFSPLLLDEDEFHVIECLAIMDCPRLAHMESGALYVCTRSLFFDPDDVTWPIIRIPFGTSSALECNQALNTMTIATSSYAMMKVNGRDEPYTFVKEKRDVSVTFKLTYAHVVKDHIHTYTQQMVALSRLPQSDSFKFQEIFLEGIEEAHRFDVGMLLDPLTERVLIELDAIMLSQMAKERGKFVVGGQGVYFEPLNDVSGRGRVEAPCQMINGVLRRQSAHMDVGLEIAFGGVRPGGARRRSGNGAWLVVFRCFDDREAAFRSLSEVLAEALRLSSRPPPVLDTLHHEHQLSEVTHAWQRGEVSNFEYLMCVLLGKVLNATEIESGISLRISRFARSFQVLQRGGQSLVQ